MKISDKTILITGGTGSFGNRVANYLEQQNPKNIIIYSRDEKKQYEMQKAHPDYRYIIGDVRDDTRINQAMKGVDYVFHAAALKHVPACENYPFEAVKTNILGPENVCRAAIANNVEAVVALSTDKAVKPVNAMGISKSMMEKIVGSQNQYPIDTRFACVRYGNVMGSRGSVIPLFKRLIQEGKPLTLTVPEMTRFMMTLDESVELVLHALTNAKGGEVFVKKAPAATVQFLAETMLKKYGDGDLSRIEVVGIRPGEKMDEVLVNEYEIRRAKEEEKFFTVYPEYKPFNINETYPLGYEYHSANTHRITDYQELSDLLDRMGDTEFYT
ncbi:UDP-N-acetylglucosamine 4,6-dehydratase family protein [Carboxylicivirga marina]|uniref:Polysaccharide biosynthesis protein n=1 Tax=Carboxylicivirga marina TaxID=2800988 RepID=A0ABS1HK74_9BACT|nr:UDP-N-acetylglucosamine 4,6-dehydratase family protein [Carboxylicivirga marina]MBK3517678.1 polysaccharide biosynthesis protein [Carboxylicivirga marina]